MLFNERELKVVIFDLDMITTSNDSFILVLNRIFKCGIADNFCSQVLGVSLKTYQNWRKGVYLPHNALRKQIYKILQNSIKNIFIVRKV